MKRPLYNRVRSFRGGANFAMPGHKGRIDFDFDLRDDVTEITGADNLLDPEACLVELESEMASIYNTAETVLIPAGSTTSIKIALYLATRPGETILVQRNSHISLFHAAVALDLHLRYLPTEVDDKTGLFLGVRPKDVVQALRESPEIRTVFLTSPDYFGGILKLKEIADMVHERGAKLIVDEAHGAHLPFTTLSNYSAVNLADYTVHSLHKTTPALTGAALLHTKEFHGERLRRGMRLFLSTSPSYLTMLSSEYAVDVMDKNYNEARVQWWRRQIISTLEKVTIVDYGTEAFEVLDPSKLLFHVPGYRGDEVVELLAKKKVYLEMGDDYYALAILSPYNTDEEYQALIDAIGALEPRKELRRKHIPQYPRDAGIVKPRHAFFAQREYIPIRKAAGRIASENLTPYPPGIPLVSFGEEISGEILSVIEQYDKAIGVEDGKIAVLKEESCDIF